MLEVTIFAISKNLVDLFGIIFLCVTKDYLRQLVFIMFFNNQAKLKEIRELIAYFD